MNPDRSWMYNRNNPGRAGMIPEFAEDIINAELAAVAEREKKREEREKKREEQIAAAKEVENKRYAALQAQLTFLFESGNIFPPCPASSDGSDQEGDENDKESEGDEE
ncbi:hypothetical protein KY289_001441 [Solanum tuberosum]|nr:hypothetical protein KY284_032506 [Solanum tuberosum]KAH0730253.1 hypothetical protein KY289_001441 [Solanum tuberosum]